MKVIDKILNSYMLLAILLIAVATANAQDARINLDNLKELEKKAEDVIEVSIDGKLLNLGKSVLLKTKDKDAKVIGEAIKGLEGIYVRVYKFKSANEYKKESVDEIRSQLKAPGWEKLVKVRSKKDNQHIDVFTMFQGNSISGLAAIISEDKSITVVNVIGPVDIDLLAELGGNLGIPEFEVETEKEVKDEKDN